MERTTKKVWVALFCCLIWPTLGYAFTGDQDGDSVTDGWEWQTASNGLNPASTPESLFYIAVFGGTGCTNGLDDDLDGFIDAADTGCINTDGDAIDYFGIPTDNQYEQRSGSSPTNGASHPENWFWDAFLGFNLNCGDNVDNDLDGVKDLSDITCYADKDLDGSIDIFDNEGGFQVVNTNGLFGLSDCTDGVDNNGNGLTDLLDPFCIDTDGDGIGNPYESEGAQPNQNGPGGVDDCFDGFDNDNDGFIDGAEASCNLCYFQAPTITGTAGPDILVGTAGIDVILAGAGDDVIRGLGGDDIICGGPGNDKINGGTQSDRIGGGDGVDRITGGAGEDQIEGGAGDDMITSGGDDDEVYGGSGNDRIKTGGGDDYAFGDDGDDLIVLGGGADYAEGEAGNDLIRGGGGDDELYGGIGGDELVGGGGYDYLYGEAGNDTLKGGGGVDRCDGGTVLLDTALACELVFNIP